jgi:UDP-3-O-[3-hydroxymyristoyl] N-acetylglucosamine deacetylase
MEFVFEQEGFQRTLNGPIEFRGVGLHSNRKVNAIIEPAPGDTGIRILRLDKAALIHARQEGVVDTRFATVLGNKTGDTVGTVEHFMAALYGMGVDNAIIKVDGPEMPILDGSALPIAEKIEAEGIVELGCERRVLVARGAPHIIQLDDSLIIIEESPHLSISVTINFAGTLIGEQTASFALTGETFKREIAPARTFVLKEQIEGLWSSGLALGGSLENAVVVDGPKVMNEEGLRFTDECARHKVLDLLGDFSLLGFPLRCSIVAVRPGHTINSTVIRELSRKIQENSENTDLQRERIITGATTN